MKGKRHRMHAQFDVAWEAELQQGIAVNGAVNGAVAAGEPPEVSVVPRCESAARAVLPVAPLLVAPLCESAAVEGSVAVEGLDLDEVAPWESAAKT